ncbi:Aldo/keto reductase [Thozetella sp. PMI_491]|nr:Aldo/keto reductase [Thozetella sp. PMI_491]
MAPHLVFGGSGIGTTEKSYAFTFDTPEKVSELLVMLKQLGILEIDSAASYPESNPWNTETLLGEAGAVERGFIIDSKVDWTSGHPSLTKSNISRSTAKTLELFNTKKIRTMYIHTPDKETPLEETAAAFHEQYLAGKFERLGICNLDLFNLSKYLAICDKHGYIKPTVYQGCYNAVFRKRADGLFPLLRKHGCAFYAYSPLAGGFLTGKVTQAVDSGDESALYRTRWRGESIYKAYVSHFDTPAMHNAVRTVKAVCEAASPALTLQEACLRWLIHHSELRDSDAIILGAKRLDELEKNVTAARRGPLSGTVLHAIETMSKLANKDEKF